ncbi:response regulator [Deinococcus hohokamensis]|uniref:Response regulator n=1 Tax=Deinococcus hohokamensis TaxID=309883 RepID=A0ABV9ICE2_9DEIO
MIHSSVPETAASSSPAPHILVVDDSDFDVELTLLALDVSGLRCEVSVAVDGKDALDFLHGRGRHASRPAGLPTLMLLDLNMPGLSGREVLRSVKSDPDLCRIHVMVLTTSNLAEDRAACTLADDYVVKPLDLTLFVREVAEHVQTVLKAAEQKTAGAASQEHRSGDCFR